MEPLAALRRLAGIAHPVPRIPSMENPVTRTRIALSRAIVGLAALLLAACSASASASPSGSEPPAGSPPASEAPSSIPSTSPAALILRITTEGGFIGPSANLATVPTASVYADGRIMTPGPEDSIYPGQLVPPVAVRDVGAVGAEAIVAAIRAAGLDKASSAGPGIPGDTGTTVFVVSLDGSSTTTRIALGGGVPGPGGPGGGSQDPASAAALDLMSRLTDPTDTWGAASAPVTTLVPAGYRIFVAPGAPVADPSVTQLPIAWPLAVPLDQFGAAAMPDRGIPGLRLGAALGADATTLAPVFAKASVLTPFASGGLSYTLYVRPLLPDEVPA